MVCITEEGKIARDQFQLQGWSFFLVQVGRRLIDQ